MRRSRLLCIVALIGLPISLRAAEFNAESIPTGKADFRFSDERGNAERPIQVWTYRPKGFGPDSPILFVMHGTLRNGETYREPWMPLADRHQCLVVVPEFPANHYPYNAYHLGNVRSSDGQPIDESKWTFSAIEHLFDHIKAETGSRREQYYVFGHSAGAQFVHRMVLFKPNLRVAKAVAANAGGYTMPTYTAEFPYGLDKSGVAESQLSKSLGLPLVVLLGEEDTDPNDRNLPRGPAFQAQGAYRLERGRNFYRAAQEEAKRLKIDLKWTLETVPGVGHDNAKMAPAAAHALFGPGQPGPSSNVETDFLIRGATIHDGTGKLGYKGDVAIKGERIVAVGAFEAAGKAKIIDGTRLIIAPGFIDLHSHSDNPITQKATRANLNYLTQGVTTIVTGNCGAGPVDVAGYYKKIDENKAGTNVIHQVPHNALRQQVMGNVNRRPTKEELEKMKSLVDQGMRDGAWGFSTGLIYNPGTYADTDELVELAKIAAAHRGFYASHMRDEGTGLLASVHETLEIGRRAKLPVHISHMKAMGRKAWGTAAQAIALVEQARANGQKVTADQYPYIAGSTSLNPMVVPAAYREGTQRQLLERLEDPEQGPKVRAGIQELLDTLHEGGKTLRIAGYRPKPAWQGKDLVTIAAEEKRPVLDIVLEIEKNGGAGVVVFIMNEEEVRLIMKQPFVATASDGSAMIPAETVPHPRSYGCFPRKIGRYAIEEKLVPLEHAIRSASGLPADILGLPERGYIKPGHYADVVIFDPTSFRDTATYDKPHQYATGVRYLFVNGVMAIEEGKFTEKLSGRALRHGRTNAAE